MPEKAQPFNLLAVAGTPTTCCLGLVTLRGGVQLAGVLYVWAGLCQLGTWLPDFRWGPESYDWLLQYATASLGLASIAVGIMGMRCSRDLNLQTISRVKTFHRFSILWTCLWFCLVGLPTEIAYSTAPVIQQWPLSAVPGTPQQLVVDPQWPNGKPHVCGDMAKTKHRLAIWLNRGEKNAVFRQIFKALYHQVFTVVLPCEQVVCLFWLWMVAETLLRIYCAAVMGYFEMVVLNGGDGMVMVGDPADLERPVRERVGTKEIMKQQLKCLFDQIDADRDGKVSLRELVDFVEHRKAL